MSSLSPALLSGAFAALLLFSAPVSRACTLFGAAGEGVAAGGGVIVTKTRDEHPGPQVVKVVTPGNGHAYFGLFTGAKERFKEISGRLPLGAGFAAGAARLIEAQKDGAPAALLRK